MQIWSVEKILAWYFTKLLNPRMIRPFRLRQWQVRQIHSPQKRFTYFCKVTDQRKVTRGDILNTAHDLQKPSTRIILRKLHGVVIELPLRPSSPETDGIGLLLRSTGEPFSEPPNKYTAGPDCGPQYQH